MVLPGDRLLQKEVGGGPKDGGSESPEPARLGQREWAAECLLLGWSGVEMIQFTLASALWHNPSYLILAGAPGLEHGTLLCISLQGRVFAA